MNNTTGKKPYQRLLNILRILFLISFALFYIPGFPGSIRNITGGSKELTIPDMRWRYDADDLNAFLTEIGHEGRAAFQFMHLTVDLLFPLVYGSFLCVLILRQTDQTKWSGKHLSLLGFIPAVLDLIENFSLMYITSQYPTPHPDLANVIQIFTTGKFLSLIIVAGFTIFLGFKFRIKDEEENN